MNKFEQSIWRKVHFLEIEVQNAVKENPKGDYKELIQALNHCKNRIQSYYK